jgi:hypothetical protein
MMKLDRALTINSFIFLTIVLLLLQTACDSQSATAGYFGGLELKTESNRSSLRSGESVHVRFTTTNTGSNPIIEEVPSRRRLISWTDQNPDKASFHAEWKPGESKVMELTWTYSGLVSPYADVVGLLSENSRMVQAASVRLCLEPCRY